ncbi:MAG TPA: iron chelate uptake ABC transporter family permease subunit, partial [Thermoanaerobaculia bacterium]|nr:iron chelate uptake ABC transporter family permease subunit [Thermoanaerobaculia bacterium]
LASVLCGIVGTFVVVKRLVFISGGISHAAFGGLGICHYLGVDYRLGAGAVAVASALALAGAGRGRGRSHDATIGILWAVGMAVGIVFLHLTPGYAPNLQTYLFGNILTVTAQDVRLTFGFVAVLVLFLALFWKELVAVAFDEAFAAVQGVPVRLVLAALMVAVALAVVFLIQLVGTLLVIALLTIPPALALRLVDGFFAVMVTATLAGALMTVGGLVVSYAFDLPSGPAIVLLGAALLLAADGWRRLQRRLAPPPAPLAAAVE